MSAPTHSQILRDLVDETDLRRKHRVGRVLRHFGAFGRHAQQRLVGSQVRLIQIGQHVDHFLPPRADHHPVGLHEVVDRHALLEKLGIAGHVDVPAGDLLQPRGQFRVGAHRHGALADDDALGGDVRPDLLDDRPERREIDRLVGSRRSSHGKKHHPRLLRRRRQIGSESQPAVGDVSRHQFGQSRLIDRDMAAVEHVDLLPVAIDANHLVARFRQARAADQSHVTGSDDDDVHVSPLRLLSNMASDRAFRAGV